MFEFSFSELMVVFVVALVVIGPERLPKVARTLGHLYGRAQRYVNGIKSDIERDMAIEEFRKLQQKVQEEADAAQRSIQQVGRGVDEQVRQLNQQAAQTLQDAPPSRAESAKEQASATLPPADKSR